LAQAVARRSRPRALPLRPQAPCGYRASPPPPGRRAAAAVMTFYYAQDQPMTSAVLMGSWTVTIIGLVVKRLEFWAFVFLHMTLVILLRTKIVDTQFDLTSLKWQAVGASQFFMTFFLTFYNHHCYARYLQLYKLSMDVCSGILFFMHELVVSLPYPATRRHRVAAAKYALALHYIFFMGVGGGMRKKSDWLEVVNRGLLTKLEAEKLSAYPARSIEVVLVIGSWAMQIVDKALDNEACWTTRSMRIAHAHNRMNHHLTSALLGAHKVGDVLGLPVPFAYYHVMNVVLIANLGILSVVTAFFKTYMTFLPQATTTMFFMGLRECSVNLADPFGPKDVNLPVSAFVQYTFDTSVCLIESFREHAEEGIVQEHIAQCHNFTSAQLRHQTTPDVVYQKNYDPALSNPFSWNKEMPMHIMATQPDGPAGALRQVTVSLPDEDRRKYVRCLTHSPLDGLNEIPRKVVKVGDVVTNVASDGEDEPKVKPDNPKKTKKARLLEVLFCLCCPICFACYWRRQKLKEVAAKRRQPSLEAKTRTDLALNKLTKLTEKLRDVRHENEETEQEVARLRENIRKLREGIVLHGGVPPEHDRNATIASEHNKAVKEELPPPQEWMPQPLTKRFADFGEARDLIRKSRTNASLNSTPAATAGT